MTRTLTLRASMSQGGSLGDTRLTLVLPRWLALAMIERLAGELNKSDVSSPTVELYGDAETGLDEGDWL